MTNRQDRIGTLRVGKLSPEFFALSADPIFWQAKASELHWAALVLAQQFFEDMEAFRAALKALEAGNIANLPSQPTSVLGQFVLLAAFSLENLFKGLVLYKEPQLSKWRKDFRNSSIPRSSFTCQSGGSVINSQRASVLCLGVKRRTLLGKISDLELRRNLAATDKNFWALCAGVR